MIKCVVWDLDGTVWPGVWLERADDREVAPSQEVVRVIDELERGGIVSAVASRSEPALRDALPRALRDRFVAVEIGWGSKSEAIRRIARTLNIGTDQIAFVDDSAFERAEVSAMLPEVTVLAPDEVARVRGAAATADATLRAARYRDEARRRDAQAVFSGSRREFLVWCRMRLDIREACPVDAPRLAELARRTRRLNTTGRVYTPDELRDGDRLVVAACLSDRFGDYGLIGGAIVVARVPELEHLMVSCRVEGRGIPLAMLRWVMERTRPAPFLRARWRPSEHNTPLRVLLRQAGFVDRGAFLERDLSAPLPPVPEWL